jgi:hypothetical protein
VRHLRHHLCCGVAGSPLVLSPHDRLCHADAYRQDLNSCASDESVRVVIPVRVKRLASWTEAS